MYTHKKNRKNVWRKNVARATKISGKRTLAANNIGVVKYIGLLLLHAYANNNNTDYENSINSSSIATITDSNKMSV